MFEPVPITSMLIIPYVYVSLEITKTTNTTITKITCPGGKILKKLIYIFFKFRIIMFVMGPVMTILFHVMENVKVVIFLCANLEINVIDIGESYAVI